MGFGAAEAAEVYINGVKVTGAIQDRALQGVNVQFNAAGDVYVNAPGYAVKSENGTMRIESSANTIQPTAEKKYWIVLKNVQVGHYQVILKVNGTKVGKTVASTQRQHLVDITPNLHSGKNEVEIVYLPVPDAPKVGILEGTEVIVGVGASSANGPLTLTRVLGSHKHKTGSSGAEAAVVNVDVP
jgi:hypothetical protein